MHQLPSGKQVSVDPAPLHRLLRHAEDPLVGHRILGLTTTEAIRAHIDVVFLVPGAAVSSGLTLAEWDRRADWTQPDRESMREFLEGHAARSLAQWEHDVANAQERILASGELTGNWLDD
jgi:hypothetical protein